MKQMILKDIKINPFELIGNNWMLISVGNKKTYNAMTASWGHLGSLWGHGLYGNPTAEIFVRPCSYTDKFVKANKYFVLSFFDSDKYKKDLLYLGSHSGRNENKISKTKLHVTFIDNLPCFKEASLTLICKKIYVGKIKKEGFIDKTIIKEFYTSNTSVKSPYNLASLHNVYVGKVIKAYKK